MTASCQWPSLITVASTTASSRVRRFPPLPPHLDQQPRRHRILLLPRAAALGQHHGGRERAGTPVHGQERTVLAALQGHLRAANATVMCGLGEGGAAAARKVHGAVPLIYLFAALVWYDCDSPPATIELPRRPPPSPPPLDPPSPGSTLPRRPQSVSRSSTALRRGGRLLPPWPQQSAQSRTVRAPAVQGKGGEGDGHTHGPRVSTCRRSAVRRGQGCWWSRRGRRRQDWPGQCCMACTARQGRSQALRFMDLAWWAGWAGCRAHHYGPGCPARNFALAFDEHGVAARHSAAHLHLHPHSCTTAHTHLAQHLYQALACVRHRRLQHRA